MNSNFLFLADRFPVLEKMGSLAEIYLYTDANACLYKMGSLAETVVNYIFELDDLTPPSGNDNTHANRIKILQRNNMLSKDISDIFYILRIKRNEAVHEGYDSFEECRTLIEMTYTLSVWFMQIYGDNEFEPIPFIAPEDIRSKADYQKLLDENEKLSAELEKAQAAAAQRPVRTHPHTHPHDPERRQHDHEHRQRDPERRQREERANRRTRLSEKETRYIIDVLVEEDNNRIEQEQVRVRKTFRKFQLEVMGFVAIFIGPLVLFTTSVTHGLKFPQSISETATIANKSGAILPFCLGALALFALTYAIVHAYDKLDKIFTVGMAAGFTMVAMQMCSSRYIEASRVGLFGVSPFVSNVLHSVGAVVGFGSMIFWIMLCFRMSDKRKDRRTKEKNLRNSIYFWAGIGMILSLSLFLINATGVFGENFPVVFAAEFAMLLIGGFACLIKGGLIFKDKN